MDRRTQRGISENARNAGKFPEVKQESQRFQGFMSAPPVPSIIRKWESAGFVYRARSRKRELGWKKFAVTFQPLDDRLDSFGFGIAKTSTGKIALSSLPI